MSIISYLSANKESQEFEIFCFPGHHKDILFEVIDLLCLHAGYNRDFLKIRLYNADEGFFKPKDLPIPKYPINL